MLVTTLESVARGELPCSPHIAASLMHHVAALSVRSDAYSPEPRLTRREVEVAALIRAGRSNKEIATTLCIALPTVKSHVHNILEKLHARRREDIVAIGTSARNGNGEI
jgi:two-component system, NarL family, nitrate/nitrite response regulator NarL